MLNSCILLGRTTTKPEMKKVSQAEGKEVVYTKFSLAVDREFDDDTDFFNCIAFGNEAKFIDKYVEKGQQIVISGRLKNSIWTNDTGRHVLTEIVVEKVYFAGDRKKDISQNQEESFI
ncbi:MAG: single-stranded DNA-binding protein [Thermoplasmata archaeon]